MGTLPELIKLARCVLGVKADSRYLTTVVTMRRHRQMPD
jgi:hypothetical protein